MRTPRQKHKASAKTEEKRSARRKAGRVYTVMHEELYASLEGPTTWDKRPERAVKFSSRAAATRWAKWIKSGPRQFAGLGSKSRVVELETGGVSDG